MKLLLIPSMLIASAYCQYPGQTGPYPPGQYPPGSYPPGQYPGQGPGIPIPRRGKGASQEQKTEQTYVTRGVVRTIDAKTMEIEADDERIVSFKLVDATKKPAGLTAGDKVEVDATRDDNGAFTATNITKTGSTKAASTAPAAAPAPSSGNQKAAESAEDARPTTTMATPVPLDPDDEGGPPTLKRGVPKARKPAAAAPTQVARNDNTIALATTATAPATSVEPAAPPPQNPRLELIEKAKTVADDFLTGLPNYVCQQFTTRYLSEGHPTNWRAQDVVSADLVYEKGQERYEHLAINGKAVKKSIEETGAWSTGEFGTVLADLFSPATAADFKFEGNRTIARRSAGLFDFDVDHPHSHWKISVPGQYITPSYHGSVWISKESGRVLRIEMQAVKVPADFPNDTTEMAVDYDDISLGTDKYLLPVKAEILSCQRGSSMCERNVIEFRNYHKYTGESTITFH